MRFSIVATFTGKMDDRGYEASLEDAIDAATGAGLDIDEPCEIGESEYSYLAGESPDNEWYKGLQDVQASGILDRKQFERFIEDLGAYAEDCLTMGTLGGPLSGGMLYCVPDISFMMESSRLIESIRVTPIPSKYEPSGQCNERTWDRLRAVMLKLYGI